MNCNLVGGAGETDPKEINRLLTLISSPKKRNRDGIDTKVSSGSSFS